MKTDATGRGTHRVNVVKQHLRSELQERLFAQDGCMLAVTDALVRAIEAAEITRAEVAQRIGKTQAFVSQVLNGTRNMTLRTAADILWACRLEVRDLVTAPIGVVEVSRDCMNAWLDQYGERGATLQARRHAHVDAAFGRGVHWISCAELGSQSGRVLVRTRSAELTRPAADVGSAVA